MMAVDIILVLSETVKKSINFHYSVSASLSKKINCSFLSGIPKEKNLRREVDAF